MEAKRKSAGERKKLTDANLVRIMMIVFALSIYFMIFLKIMILE